MRTVPKWALGTVLRAQEPPFVRRLYEKKALRGSESTPCTNRCKPDTSKFKFFQVPGLRSTVQGEECRAAVANIVTNIIIDGIYINLVRITKFVTSLAMVRVPKMRHRGFFFFSRPTGLLQRSNDVM